MRPVVNEISIGVDRIGLAEVLRNQRHYVLHLGLVRVLHVFDIADEKLLFDVVDPLGLADSVFDLMGHGVDVVVMMMLMGATAVMLMVVGEFQPLQLLFNLVNFRHVCLIPLIYPSTMYGLLEFKFIRIFFLFFFFQLMKKIKKTIWHNVHVSSLPVALNILFSCMCSHSN